MKFIKEQLQDLVCDSEIDYHKEKKFIKQSKTKNNKNGRDKRKRRQKRFEKRGYE